MTSTTEQFGTAASRATNTVASMATNTVESIADLWTQAVRAWGTPMLAGLSQVDLVPAVDRYFEFVQRTVDMSRHLTISWVEVMPGILRDQAESVGGLVREQAESARDFVHEEADKTQQAAREQAEKFEQAERDLAREARKANGDQERQAREKARQRYEGRTKAELSDQLERRNLPKTGNVDELVDRLVEADSK
jgi:hypothetical protein